MHNTHLRSLKPVGSSFFLLCAHMRLQLWSNLRPKTGDNGLCQTTFPIKIRDENRFQVGFWCEDRHATGAETCLLIRGPWSAEPLLFAWWAVRRGFSFAGLPRGLAGFQWPASVLADPKGCSGMDSSQGHQMWAHARCARCVLQCICSPCTHTRSLSTVACSTLRNSVQT